MKQKHLTPHEADLHRQKVDRRHKNLLAWMKSSVKGDYDSDDARIFAQETAAYFAASGARVRPDPKAQFPFTCVVRTNMFGGVGKHLDVRHYRNACRALEKSAQ